MGAKGLFSGNADEEGLQPRPRSGPDNAYEDTEYEERQRRIQEEIRRKIMERSQAAEERTQSRRSCPGSLRWPVLEDAAEAKRRRVQERLKQRKEAHKEIVEQVHETPDQREIAPDSFSWDDSDHDYEQAIEAQRARIEETRRQAALLQAQLSRRSNGAEQEPRRSRGSYRGPIREKLRDPGRHGMPSYTRKCWASRSGFETGRVRYPYRTV